VNKNETHYIDPNTKEPLKLIYNVHLTMPALHDGFIEVEAYSEEEAARIALDQDFLEIEWEEDSGDTYGIEVFDIDCDPPEGAVLVPATYSEADISALIEDAVEYRKTGEDHSSDSAQDGEQCR
jgi:hypothetical protein